jgi:hypothetical protein
MIIAPMITSIVATSIVRIATVFSNVQQKTNGSNTFVWLMMGVNNTMQLLIVGSNVCGDCILTLEYYKQASPYKLKMAPVHQQSVILCNPMQSVGYVSLCFVAP